MILTNLKVKGDFIETIVSELGINPNECSHCIEVSAINHVHKKHGNMAQEITRVQIAVTASDFGLIPSIIENPDYNRIDITEKPLPVIVYSKKIENEYFYLEEVRKGKNILALKTMYIKKKPKQDIRAF